nr:uncharacterized protein LOC112425801 [Macaca nemestrina]
MGIREVALGAEQSGLSACISRGKWRVQSAPQFTAHLGNTEKQRTRKAAQAEPLRQAHQKVGIVGISRGSFKEDRLESNVDAGPQRSPSLPSHRYLSPVNGCIHCEASLSSPVTHRALRLAHAHLRGSLGLELSGLSACLSRGKWDRQSEPGSLKSCLPQPLRDPKSLDHRASSGRLRGCFPLEEEEFQECEASSGNCSSDSISKRGCVQEFGPNGMGIQSIELMRGLLVMESLLIPLRRMSVKDGRAVELTASLHPGPPRCSCWSGNGRNYDRNNDL